MNNLLIRIPKLAYYLCFKISGKIKMNIVSKTAWVISILIWISSLILLIIAVTDKAPENPLKEYRLIIAIGFMTISGFIRIAYKKHQKI